MPVTITPSDNIATKMAGQPPGTTYLFTAGVHRTRTGTLSGYDPRQGDVFAGEPGAILSGAVVLTSWTQTTNGVGGTVWWATSADMNQYPGGDCVYTPEIGAVPRCGYCEDVYVDNVFQWHVQTLVEVRSGTHWYDAQNDRVYIGQNPASRTVERCVVQWLTEPSTASDVTWRDLVFEKFANVGQSGVWRAVEAQNWSVLNCEFRYNHGSGIRLSPRLYVSGCYSHHNGGLGIGGGPEGVPLEDILVEWSEFAYNNTAGFDWGWEGGGSKFVGTVRLTVRNCYFHHNKGPGIWSDIDNIYTLYERNRCEYNAIGIYHEISYDAVIRYNLCRENGKNSVYLFRNGAWVNTAESAYVFGGGIICSASRNTHIYENYVVDNADGIVGLQQNRGGGAYGEYLVQNLWVHDNIIKVTDFHHPLDNGDNPWASGIADDSGNASIFDASNRGNVFQNNDFYLPSTGYGAFAWNYGGNRTFSTVQGMGHELGSTVSAGTVPTQTVVPEPFVRPGATTGGTTPPSAPGSFNPFRTHIFG